MSALAGIIRLDGEQVAESEIQRMVDALTMYGRDAQKIWRERNAALAHLLFRTTPEDDYDQQPMVTSDHVFCFTGRLDNREALMRQLAMARQPILPDSALARAAFQQWGTESFAKLAGDFSLAIWQPQAKRLVLCRSLSGKCPLFWSRQPHYLAFSSMPKGLFALPDFPRRVDEERLAEFLVRLPAEGDRTFFRDIQRVEPGHYVVWERQQMRSVCFHRFDPENRIELPTDADYAEAFREKFEEAVRCRLRSNGGIASMLSSGFDSGTVTAVAARQLGERPLLSFTSVPRAEYTGVAPLGTHTNEWAGAAELAARYPNITHLPIAASDNLLDGLDEVTRAADHPFRNLANLGWWDGLAAEAAARGARVVLTGAMGNACLSWNGQALLPGLLAQGRLLRWASEVRAMRQLGQSWRGLLFRSLDPFLPNPLTAAIHRWKNPYTIADVMDTNPIHPQWVQQFGLDKRLATAQQDMLVERGMIDSRAARCENLIRHDGGSNHMAVLARHGIEMRDPTGDSRFMEFCLAIPETQFMRRGQNRFILRSVYGDALAPSTLTARTRGMQGADWQVRLNNAPVQQRLQTMQQSPLARRALDLDTLVALLENGLPTEEEEDWSKARWEMYSKVPLALITGAFMEYVEGGE